MALMEDALAYLQITWQDKTLQRKLEGGIERGKVLLEEYAGTTLNFDVPGRRKRCCLTISGTCGATQRRCLRSTISAT